jgi:hypothetical protein
LLAADLSDADARVVGAVLREVLDAVKGTSPDPG